MPSNAAVEAVARAPLTHHLKADPVPFSDVLSGAKRCEVRLNDRDYRVGDTLRLLEFDRDLQEYSGRECVVRVTHIQTGYGLPDGLIVMSVERAGHAVVPMEPTERMVDAGKRCYRDDPKERAPERMMADLYRAMIAQAKAEGA